MHTIRRFIKSSLRDVRLITRFIRTHIRAILVWGIGAGFLLGGLIFIWAATLQIPDLSSIENRKVQQSLKIYDRTGEVLLYDLNNHSQRTVVPLKQIAPYVAQATLAMEDPSFYQHKGIEPYAIARAIFVDITSLGLRQGGSTLTQQVVKNTILTNDKTITRKLKEWVLALKLERVLTKDQILGLYLNQAPYGGRIYGVEEASQVFFDKHASDVNLAEAAYLATVLPAPTYYSPYGNNRASLDSRKNVVLDKMFEHGYITAEERDQAKQEVVTFMPPRDTSIQAPHFVFYVRQYLEEKYGSDVLEQGGWTVITTLDADIQVAAEETIQAHAESNQKNFNASNMALVATDPKNGHILAMVGSRNYFDEEIDGNYNIALAKRQPGSAFKPFAYAAAFNKGYTPETVLFDVQTQFSTNCAPDNFTSTDGCYSPVNYDNKFRGPMTLREALAQSINIPAIKVLYLAGISDTLRLAKSMGISTLGDANQYGLTLVLGGGEVTLLDITNAYGAFAQNGMHYNATPILQIKDTQGTIIEDNTTPQGTQVLAPKVAQQISDVLSDNNARNSLGENNVLNFSGYDVAAKTGTTNNYRDAWIVGYTPSIVVGMWAGNNDNSSMVHKVSGLIIAPIWREVMSKIIPTIPHESFQRGEYSYVGVKPVLRGIWQGNQSSVVGDQEVITQSVHEILFWVDKNNPNGSVPANPSNDPQFRFWDPPVRNWAAKNGYVDGVSVGVGPAYMTGITPIAPIIPTQQAPMQ